MGAEAGRPPAAVPAATSGPAVLAIRELRYAYGRRGVLDGIDLEVRAGEIYGLLGPNGAGKTTLVRAICGRLAPDAGSVRLQDRDLARLPAARRAIGLVPQEIGLYGHLSVRENLQTFGRLAGLRGAALREAVARALAACRLEERRDQRVASLSGGLARRANIAAALLHEPVLLILDEPTVGIDPEARRAIDGVIRGLADGGLAVLLVTHDLAQAGHLCDRVGLLFAGRLRAEGPPRALLDRHFHGRRELLVELAERPGPTAAGSLAALGLEGDASGLIWQREVEQDRDALGDWSRRVEGLGLPLQELRLREPGLPSLFARLEAEAAGDPRP